MGTMPTSSEHTLPSLEARLGEHARTAWPQLEQLHVRHRSTFAYVEAELADGERVKLMGYAPPAPSADGASPSTWPAATATTTPYSPTGSPTGTGTPADAFDCACRLHLAAPDT
jgi:hypothetical protein